MSFTNKTEHYNLPQYIGSDIPSILVDVNGAYNKIDEVMFGVSEQSAESAEMVTSMRAELTGTTTQSIQNKNDITIINNTLDVDHNRIDTIAEQLTQVDNRVGHEVIEIGNTVSGAINELNSKIGVNSSDIGDMSTLQTIAHTLVGGINEVNNKFKTSETLLFDGSVEFNVTDTSNIYGGLNGEIPSLNDNPDNYKKLLIEIFQTGDSSIKKVDARFYIEKIHGQFYWNSYNVCCARYDKSSGSNLALFFAPYFESPITNKNAELNLLSPFLKEYSINDGTITISEKTTLSAMTFRVKITGIK